MDMYTACFENIYIVDGFFFQCLNMVVGGILTQDMEHDLAGSGLAHAIVGCAYVDAALVPIHILDGEDVRVELLLAWNGEPWKPHEKCNPIRPAATRTDIQSTLLVVR